jgi:hypothetical protein
MAGPAASLPGVRFGRGRGLHRRCCPLLRLWGRLRWPGRRAPPALPGWGGRCPWCPPLAVRRRRGRCRGLHQRCHSCVPLALDLPPRWRFGPGALGSRTACGCRAATVLPVAGAGGSAGTAAAAGLRWCGRGRTSGCGAPLLRLPDRRCARTALRCPLPGRETPSGAGPRLRPWSAGAPRAPAQRAANCGTGTPTPPQMEREGEAAANAAAARAAVWRDRPARRGGVPGSAGVVGTQKAATAATSLHSLLLCFCWWGGLRRPVAAVAGVASVPYARVLAKSEEPPPRTRGRERTTSGAATQRPRHLPATPTASTASFQPAPPSKHASPSAPALFASRALRLRAPSPPAAGRSAADSPGPPKHPVAPRGVWRCRHNASRQQSGIPAGCGHLWSGSGGGREVGQR